MTATLHNHVNIIHERFLSHWEWSRVLFLFYPNRSSSANSKRIFGEGIVALLALISFIYSFIETKKGYIVLKAQNNHLTINNPFQKSGTLKFDEISYIKESKVKELIIFNIHLKNQEIIQYQAPSFLYSNIPLFGNHEYKLALEKEIRKFFKEISDYFE